MIKDKSSLPFLENSTTESVTSGDKQITGTLFYLVQKAAEARSKTVLCCH